MKKKKGSGYRVQVKQKEDGARKQKYNKNTIINYKEKVSGFMLQGTGKTIKIQL